MSFFSPRSAAPKRNACVARASCVVFITRSAPRPLDHPEQFTTKTVGPETDILASFFFSSQSASSFVRNRAHARVSRSRLAASRQPPLGETRGRADRGDGLIEDAQGEHTRRAEQGVRAVPVQDRDATLGEQDGVRRDPRVRVFTRPPATGDAHHAGFALGPATRRGRDHLRDGRLEVIRKARHAIAPDLSGAAGRLTRDEKE